MPSYGCTVCGRVTKQRQCPDHQRDPNRSWSPSRDRGTQARFRKRVLRDAGHRCERCGSTAELVAHHLISVSRGGSDDPANGVALCDDCHRIVDPHAR